MRPAFGTLRFLALAGLLLLPLLNCHSAPGDDAPAIFPLSQVQPGMKGVAYTIFSGDQIEPVNLQIIGVLRNALGPKEDVILVKLLGDKAQETGVVAGMSGSPVYVDGKLLGALSLKLGAFTKEAIGGVTPIEEMLDVERDSAHAPPAQAAAAGSAAPNQFAQHVSLPQEFAASASAGAGQFLTPIETPMITAGLYPDTIARFGKQLSEWGMAMMAGGTAPASPDDAKVKPGDMVSVDLIRGDLSAGAACTITTVEANQILACGHPIYGFGSVAMPMSRAHVLLTLASSQESTKVVSTGGVIGTLTQDRSTAIMGRIGPGPPMIPMDVTLTTPSAEKKFHFEVIESPQLTPLLVALAAYNGISGNPAYGEGSTLELDGDIEVKGHTPVRLQDLFAPTDTTTPNGLLVALEVQNAFASIFSNPYEQPQVQQIHLNVKAVSERRWAVIDSAWPDKSEVEPGETVRVKVLLRPYRGAPFIREIPITIPLQAQRGTLQLLVSDAATLNRNVQFLAANSAAQLPGLEELIGLINRERHNDRLYATLLQPTPTLLVADKEMPNAPASEISVLDQRQSPGNARVLWQSAAGEWSVDMHQVIAGEDTLTLTVK